MKFFNLYNYDNDSGKILEDAYIKGKVSIHDYNREQFEFLIKKRFLSPTFSAKSSNFVSEWYTLSEQGYRLILGEIRLKRRWVVTTVISILALVTGAVSLMLQLIPSPPGL